MPPWVLALLIGGVAAAFGTKSLNNDPPTEWKLFLEAHSELR